MHSCALKEQILIALSIISSQIVNFLQLTHNLSDRFHPCFETASDADIHGVRPIKMNEKYLKTTSKVTSSQVAELAGVSRSAVSRTFSNGKVSKETRAKVLEAASQLGYEENRLAKGLIQGKSGIVCIVADQIESPWHAKLTGAIIDRVQASGRVASVITSGAGGAEDALRRTIHFRAEATIILSGSPPRSIAEQCVRFGQKIILIDRSEDLENSLCINPDNGSAAASVCEMVKMKGMHEFAYLTSATNSQGLRSRLRAFKEAARSLDVDLTVIEAGPTSYVGGQLLANELLTRSEYPRCVFCATDLLACGFIDTAMCQFELRTPKDLNVVGFDDIAQAGWSNYDLTTFRQPVEEIAQLALEFIDGKDTASAKTVKQQLIIRSSMSPKP